MLIVNRSERHRTDVVSTGINLTTFAGTCGDGRGSDARDVRANRAREKGLPPGEWKFFPLVGSHPEPAHSLLPLGPRELVV